MVEEWNLHFIRSETFVNHTAVEKPTTTLCMFQMAKLDNSVSTYFEETAVKPKDRKLTCEAGPTANLRQGPVCQKSRDACVRKRCSFISGHGSKMDAHPKGIGPSLQIVANQRAEEK